MVDQAVLFFFFKENSESCTLEFDLRADNNLESAGSSQKHLQRVLAEQAGIISVPFICVRYIHNWSSQCLF